MNKGIIEQTTASDAAAEQAATEDNARAAQPELARPLLISECFRTIQGEGQLIGRPTVFVRTGGCDYRCARCDTLYAVLPEHRGEWTPMSPAEVFAEVEHLTEHRPILVTLSGGNP